MKGYRKKSKKRGMRKGEAEKEEEREGGKREKEMTKRRLGIKCAMHFVQLGDVT